jgi:hypothetical protein
MRKLLHTAVAVLLTGAASAGTTATEPPAPADLAQLWADLGTGDAVQVDRAMTSLVAQPAHAVAFLRQRLHPVCAPDPRRLAGWLAGLDSDEFAVREQATHELEKLGEVIELDLKRAQSQCPSPEVRRRIKNLLGKVKRERLSPSAERLRAVRGVEVLERIGDRAARRHLATLAGGAPEAQVTIDAQTALERLSQSAVPMP